MTKTGVTTCNTLLLRCLSPVAIGTIQKSSEEKAIKAQDELQCWRNKARTYKEVISAHMLVCKEDLQLGAAEYRMLRRSPVVQEGD